ncbi:pregnancy-associated glycoprotein-like [Bos indicus x Bos taurus]|uniref:pregnancy-associated glycoprotein-like n=1 Tax=Bos indicus x Bos taurus TaxID=30522 RepID=UPI000F7D40EF|nr:pregnancy-associated glycoprotein-like [Bos indicus x Bos taurus]
MVREGQSWGTLQSDHGVRFVPLSLSISMNGKLIACKRGCQAIMDTGTTFLLGPSRHIAKIQRLIRIRPFGSLQYTVPCNITSTLPPLIFTIKGIDYPVPAQAYIHKMRGQS